MFYLSVVLFLIFFPSKAPESNFLIVQEKKITVVGTTSLGRFSCDYTISEMNDTLFIKENTKAYNIQIPVENFNCGNFLLNKDFKKTLRSDYYPQINVKVQNIRINPDGNIKGSLEIELTDKIKRIQYVTFERCNVEKPELISLDLTINVSDFNLTPPKRLGGLIKVEESMDIFIEMTLLNI